MIERLLTSEELAARLGVDENTVYRWSRQGRIPALKVGRWWRFHLQDVEHALSSDAPVDWRSFVAPLGLTVRPGDHLVCYDVEPRAVSRIENAFVTAGLKAGNVVARVTWGQGDVQRHSILRRIGLGRDARLVTLDARSVPVERAEEAVRKWSQELRAEHPGAASLWIYGVPPLSPSADPRLASLEATLGRLAASEGWVVLCLYARSAVGDRGRLLGLHVGELSAAANHLQVLVPRP